MSKVVIRQCPVWGTIRSHAASLAAALRKEPDLDVQLMNGSQGELTVTVDGREVARKGDKLPQANDVLSAIHQATHA